METDKPYKLNRVWENLAQWPLIIWIIFSVFTCTSGSFYLQIVTLVFSSLFTFRIFREHWRRKKEGYYVDLRVFGPDDGEVLYIEGVHQLNLVVDFYHNVVSVPSDERWQEIMPEWAKNRKEEIIRRIKKHSNWRDYKEDDRLYTHVPKKL